MDEVADLRTNDKLRRIHVTRGLAIRSDKGVAVFTPTSPLIGIHRTIANGA
jgi:hypothetical protein